MILLFRSRIWKIYLLYISSQFHLTAHTIKHWSTNEERIILQIYEQILCYREMYGWNKIVHWIRRVGWIWNSVQLLLAVAVVEYNGNPSNNSFIPPAKKSTQQKNMKWREPQSTQQGNFPTMITLFLQLYTIIEEFNILFWLKIA